MRSCYEFVPVDEVSMSGEYPFCAMGVGKIVKMSFATYDDKLKAQRYAHCYGKKTGKAFKTKTINGGQLLVQRVA